MNERPIEKKKIIRTAPEVPPEEPTKEEKELKAIDSLEPDKKLLEIRKMASEIKERYNNDVRQESFNLLLLGESGSGKTILSSTGRLPVHIDSFDDGGTKGLQKEIKENKVIADTQFESDDPFFPTTYLKWKREFDKRVRLGYFNHIGTYVLDSSTMWSAAIMNWILKKAGMAGGVPRFTHDYHPQKVEIVNHIKKCLDLPCDFILTGHLEGKKDDVTGKIQYRFMTTGKAEITIPLAFDEIWVADTKETASGINYKIITGRTGPYLAATRIGRGVFETYEEPNIKALLKKAGRSVQDKPLF